MPLLSDLQPRAESFATIVSAIYACGRIEQDISVGKEAWMHDAARQDAVTYRLIILGETLKRFVDLYEGRTRKEKDEAASKQSKKSQGRAQGPKNRDMRFLDLDPDDYSKIIKFRDRNAHLVSGRNLEIVWDVASNQLPPIAEALIKGGRYATPAWLERAGKTAEEEFVAEKVNEWMRAELPRLAKLMLESVKPSMDELSTMRKDLLNSINDAFHVQHVKLVEDFQEIQRRQAESFRKMISESWSRIDPNLFSGNQGGNEDNASNHSEHPETDQDDDDE